jgi:hypothetical protein
MKSDQFVLLVHGSSATVDKAKHILGRHAIHRVHMPRRKRIRRPGRRTIAPRARLILLRLNGSDFCQFHISEPMQ